MEYIIICIVAFMASGLTLLSGFGLGSLLMPAFAIFFPAEIAVAMTAIVHLANNLFKLTLLGKYANKSVVLKFGIPAIFAAYLGANALLWLADMQPIYVYELFQKQFRVMPVNLTIGVMIITFVIVELIPGLKNFSISENYLPIGGVFSGFFGGLSGHQGSIRTIFLLRTGLSKEPFIATGVVIACLIDVSRIFVYSHRFTAANFEGSWALLISAILAAFTGAFIGRQLMKKVTMRGIQILISIMLTLLAAALCMGLI